MKRINNIYISGLGAVGAAYASKLYNMNPDCVKVIATQERIERYTKTGITINGTPYSFNYIQPETTAEPADLIIIAVKQHHLEQSISDIQNFVEENTIILALLNGIISEEIIGNTYGIDKLLYSYCVGIDAVREGTNIEFSKSGKIVFGEKTNITYSAKVEAVKELFERADIPYLIPENMIKSLWWKFLMNVGINQASAVLKAPYKVFHKIKEARELMEMASREVVLISEKAGINLTEEDIKEFTKIIYSLSPEGKTSMLQDIEAGRKTEVEIFAGTVIDFGLKYGIATPVNDALYKMICTLEQIKTDIG